MKAFFIQATLRTKPFPATVWQYMRWNAYEMNQENIKTAPDRDPPPGIHNLGETSGAQRFVSFQHIFNLN